MRVVFLGFQTWGHVTLEALLADPRHSVSLVITHPESEHPYETIWADSVAELAQSVDVDVVIAQSANGDEVKQRIEQARPDVLVCSDWRTWVAPEVLSLAEFQGINIHDGLLPTYGGFAPINWAIISGEREAGLTAHCMTEEFDLGDILVQYRVPIGFTDTATDVAERVFSLLGKVTLEALDRVADVDFQPQPQDRTKATFFHKRSMHDSQIDWSLSPLAIYNLVRAQSDPYPNAYTFHRGQRSRVPHYQTVPTADLQGGFSVVLVTEWWCCAGPSPENRLRGSCWKQCKSRGENAWPLQTTLRL